MSVLYTTLPGAPATDAGREAFCEAVQAGLSRQPRKLPSRYFYDDAGSALFQEIMKLDAYYLTRCEHAILYTHAEALLSELDAPGYQRSGLGRWRR